MHLGDRLSYALLPGILWDTNYGNSSLLFLLFLFLFLLVFIFSSNLFIYYLFIFSCASVGIEHPGCMHVRQVLYPKELKFKRIWAQFFCFVFCFSRMVSLTFGWAALKLLSCIYLPNSWDYMWEPPCLDENASSYLWHSKQKNHHWTISQILLHKKRFFSLGKPLWWKSV
jgi:hypothetical protein